MDEDNKNSIKVYEDDYKLKDSDQLGDKEILCGTDLLQNNVIICGQSMSGKTTLLVHYLI